jgi:hypothetical protein
MISLSVSPNSDLRLVDQIVTGIKRQIQDRHLRPGSKLPAICGRGGARASIRRTRLRLRMLRVLSRLTI